VLGLFTSKDSILFLEMGFGWLTLSSLHEAGPLVWILGLDSGLGLWNEIPWVLGFGSC
jgi:hypothetical protein